jgi:hypothetical protein
MNAAPGAPLPEEGRIVDDEEKLALWARVRADYDLKLSHRKLAEKHGVPISTLKDKIKQELWPPRRRSRLVDRPVIITRMFRVLELQVKDLETEMAEMARNAKRSGEKEVALLGKMAVNLDKLMELDRAAGEGRRTRQRTKDMQDIRNRLIERIEQLKRD